MKNYFFTLAFAFITVIGFGQFKTLLPPSPNASEIGKYGEIPVNLSTGILNYSIPLTSARSGDLTFPITLNYSYSGYRPNEEPGWVGRGWNLSAGGVIVRNQKGLPDEKEYNSGSPNNIQGGYMVTIGEVNNLYNTATTSTSLTNSFGNLIDNQFDSEPDVFTVSCGKLTGKFYFGYKNTEKTETGFIFVSRKNVKIVYNVASIIDPGGNSSQRITSFKITDEEGTNYYFDKPEFGWQTPLNSSSSNLSYEITSWHISKIESQKGEKIEFIYQETSPSILKDTPRKQILVLYRGIFSPSATLDAGACGNISFSQGENKVDYLVSSSTELTLSEIRSRESTLFFISTRLEKDLTLSTGPKSYYTKLSQIEQKNVNNNSVLKWEFEYSQALSQNNEFLLKNLQQTTETDSYPPYTFEYNSESTLISTVGSHLYYTTYAIDQWDYYNGIYNKTGNTGTLLESEGAIRVPVLENTKLGALDKVTYPTGGFTKFEYELNDYSKLPGEFTNVWNPDSQTEVSITPSNLNEAVDYQIKYLNFRYQSGNWGFEPEASPTLFPFTPTSPTKCIIRYEGQGSGCGSSGCDICCQITSYNAYTLDLVVGTTYTQDDFFNSALKANMIAENNPNIQANIEIK